MKNTALNTLMLTTGTIALVAAFENDGGKWKVDADGNLEKDSNGNPVYVGATGTEMTIEPNTVSRLNAEAMQHRKDKEAAEKALLPFKDIDPVAAKKAIADMKDVDLANMVEKGELDRVKEEITKQFTTQLEEKDKAIADSNSTIDNLRLDRAFDTSEFVNENIVLPEYVRMKYGDRFKVVDGKVVPHGADGNPLMSKSKIGEVASFDEAVGIYLDNDPKKDTLMKADGQGGSGNSGDGGGRGKGRVVRRADFDAMNPAEKQEVVASVGKKEAQIVD